MNKPLLSICIPTFNRALYLKECLDSIANQFSNPKIMQKVEVIILDNLSTDKTEEIVKTFTTSFENIKYIKDDKNRDIVRGIIKVASLASGKYIWVFSDDDIHIQDSLKTVIDFVNKNNLDLIFCNLIGFSEKYKKQYVNLLATSEDVIIGDRRKLFEILNTKFYYTIDYYTTLCSNWIIRSEVFSKNNYIFDKFNDKLDLFPLPSLFFYTKIKFKSGIISKEIILNRGGNAAWGKKNIISNFFYVDRIWRDYYRKILKYNKMFLPRSFRFKVFIKDLLRKKDLLKVLIIKILLILNIHTRPDKINCKI